MIVPISGIALRAFVSHWGDGVKLAEALTLAHFADIWEQPSLMRGILNTVLIGVIGGAIAVICYSAIALAMHRKPDGVTRFLDYSVLVPRAVPGLLAGLSFLWVFLFVPAALDNLLQWFDNDVARWLSENVDSATARGALDHLLGLAGVLGGVDGLWPAPDHHRPAAGRAGAGRSRRARSAPAAPRSRATSRCRWSSTA